MGMSSRYVVLVAPTTYGPGDAVQEAVDKGLIPQIDPGLPIRSRRGTYTSAQLNPATGKVEYTEEERLFVRVWHQDFWPVEEGEYYPEIEL